MLSTMICTFEPPHEKTDLMPENLIVILMKTHIDGVIVNYLNKLSSHFFRGIHGKQDTKQREQHTKTKPLV